MNIEEMSARDRGMYWNGTYVFNKETGKALFVREMLDDVVLLNPAGTGESFTKEVSINDFIKDYVLHRTRLGWINIGIGCIFGYSSPGRGTKKAYSSQDIQCFSPIWDGLHKLYSDVRQELLKNDPIMEKEETVKKISTVNQSLLKCNYLQPRAMNYLGSCGNALYTKRDAFDLLHSDSLGCAIHPYWALIQLPSNSPRRANIFYQKRIVGSVDLDNRTSNIYPRFNELQPAWRRIE